MSSYKLLRVLTLACLHAMKVSPTSASAQLGLSQVNGGPGPETGVENPYTDGALLRVSEIINRDSGFDSSPMFRKTSAMLVAHAVLAVLAWAFLVPIGAIILRVNVNSPLLLRLHIICQLFAYIGYVVAAGMGIWLAQQAAQYGTWKNSHPIIGLVILVVALFQPLFGWNHHRLFKQRLNEYRSGRVGLESKRPGRTLWSRYHVWVGRSLIVLGVVNGGLGVRLAARSPYQSAWTTRNAEIAYGILAAFMFTLYAGVTMLFEYRKAAREKKERGTGHYVLKDQPPAFPSEDSLPVVR